MKKSLIIILSIFFISGFLVCVNIEQVLGYDFELDSGLVDTGLGTGHYDTSGLTPLPLSERIGQVVGAGLAFVGVLFLILMIYGGYIWMIARGNEQEVEKAKNIIRNALIGLVVVIAAYSITRLVFFSAPTI